MPAISTMGLGSIFLLENYIEVHCAKKVKLRQGTTFPFWSHSAFLFQKDLNDEAGFLGFKFFICGWHSCHISASNSSLLQFR